MSAVEGHSVVVHQNVAYVFGGKNKRDAYVDDLWAVTVGPQGAVWAKVQTTGDPPAPRAYHGAALWRERYMMVVGGVGSGGVTAGAVHVLDLEERVWRTREATGDVPAVRCHHTLNVSANHDKLYMYGGYPVGPEADSMFSSGRLDSRHRAFYEFYELQLSGADLTWNRLPCVEEFPPTLWGHTASLYFNNLIVFGGVDVVDNKESCLACVWHCDKGQWRWVEFNVVPQARALHTATVHNGCVLVFGGFGLTNTCKYNDTWSFSMETGQWVEVAAGGELPSPRSGHATFMLGDQLVVVGGVDAEHRRLNDVHVLHMPTAQWRRLPIQVRGAAPIPAPQPNPADERMAGVDKAQRLLDRATAQGARYDAIGRRHFSSQPPPQSQPHYDQQARQLSPPRGGAPASDPQPVATSALPLPRHDPVVYAPPPPPRPNPKMLPPQPVYDRSLESIVPFSDPLPQTDNRHTSPRRANQPPAPPARPSASQGVQFSQSVQTEAGDAPAPPQPAPVVRLQAPAAQPDPALETEAATIIQKQRQEIELLRSMLENKEPSPTRELRDEMFPYSTQQAPPAPHISLTKETISDMMPRMVTNVIDTPAMMITQQRAPRESTEGLLSHNEIQDLIDRRLKGGGKPLRYKHPTCFNFSFSCGSSHSLYTHHTQPRCVASSQPGTPVHGADGCLALHNATPRHWDSDCGAQPSPGDHGPKARVSSTDEGRRCPSGHLVAWYASTCAVTLPNNPPSTLRRPDEAADGPSRHKRG